MPADLAPIYRQARRARCVMPVPALRYGFKVKIEAVALQWS
jgi:hypothetical protein